MTLPSVTPSMVGDVRRARQFLSLHSRTDTTPENLKRAIWMWSGLLAVVKHWRASRRSTDTAMCLQPNK